MTNPTTSSSSHQPVAPVQTWSAGVDTTLTVQASHEEKRPAELATLTVTVGFEGPERTRVMAAVVAGADGLRSSISAQHDAVAGPVSRWSAQAPRTWNWRPRADDGTVMPVVHSAEVELSVTFSDFVVLAAWIEDVSMRSGVKIGRVKWELTDEAREVVVRRVRDRAVREAAEKARAYAASLDLGVVAVLEVADVGMLLGATSGDGMVAAASMRGSAGGGPVLVLKPEDITVTAAVDARFLARPVTG